MRLLKALYTFSFERQLAFFASCQPYSGGYSAGVPPLPIPNREVTPGFHLFPFRTEKLSPATPMVLRNSGRVGSCRFFKWFPASVMRRGTFFVYTRRWVQITGMNLVQEIFMLLFRNFGINFFSTFFYFNIKCFLYFWASLIYTCCIYKERLS